ncbi:MAG: UTP--glucose-1-phosphate uridylyltransferase GalU [Bacilli bacterium]|nr:UTP--glucose-1-phosphate uridylyltransferase GalU [Bacilli bacterium]MDD4608147.1 UTP--glucose-1-phosphate uridylyltransferase GalU [Bacilli bacterium]
MKKIRKAVIPVAGMGTRFLPITKSVPKEMLPIVDRPTLDYIIDEAVASGIEEILLITSPYKKVIEDYYDEHYELESRLEKSGKLEQLELVRGISKKVSIFYRRQGEPMGSGHAINLARNFIGDEPFAVLYGDDLMKYDKPVLKQLIEVYEKYDCNVIGVSEVPRELVNKYGIIEFEDKDTGKIKTIVEKPSIDSAPSNIAGLGRYIVKSDIFDILDDLKPGVGNEVQFTDAMKELMNSQDFYVCQYEGTYYDTGSKLGYMKANIDFGLEHQELKDGLKVFINEKNN